MVAAAGNGILAPGTRGRTGSRDLDETAGQRPFSVSARCLNSSMSSQPIEHLHPVLDFAQRLVSRLDSLADAPLMSMRPEDKRAALVTLARGRAQLDALALRLLADAERSEATVESGAGTAADWVAVETRQVRREARADLRLAENLEQHRGPGGGDGRGPGQPRPGPRDRRVVGAAAADRPVRCLGRAACGRGGTPGGAGGRARREGVAGPGSSGLRGDRTRPGRGVRGPGAGAGGSRGAAAYDVDDVGGRRRHLPRTVPPPRPARADADQDDPRDLLTRPRRRRRCC